MFTKKALSKFISDNNLPRYLLYGIILVKMTTIYDKLRQLVAIKQVYYQMVRDERKKLMHLQIDANMMQDLITKKILEE